MASATAIPPFSAIGDQFIAPKTLELMVLLYPGRNFVITDINHKILLKVKPCDTSFHQQLELLDADDKPVALLREKKLTMHDRWNVYKGKSDADSDMLFSAKNEHMIQFKTHVSMILANKDDCALKIKGSWKKRNITIYMGSSSTTIAAQMHKVECSKKKKVKDKFMVTIQANMDYACVVALLAIVDAMENPDEKKSSGGAVIDMVTTIAIVASS